MLAQVLSGSVLGVDAYMVRVEVDLTSGLPTMSVVGLPESAVREGRERVVAAIVNSGFQVPVKRVTVNLAPADLRKDGSAFDLPIAMGLLAAAGVIAGDILEGVCLVGELGLDGELRPVRGVLPLALRCRDEGVARMVVPVANAREAGVVAELDVRAARSLRDVADHLAGTTELPGARTNIDELFSNGSVAAELDFADVRGQEHCKRALEVAAAGQHNLIMAGPPGSGKSMLARRLPGIMPPLTRAEALEVTRIHSVAGRLRAGQALVTVRPFRAPHHTSSEAALVGGGGWPRPGEVSLAHNGVLFLDELPEFRRGALEALRQPLEDGVVNIGRARTMVAFPARFMLVAAMNPCPCGYFGSGQARCVCHEGQVHRYLTRVSGPLLDRMDIQVDVPALKPRELEDRGACESSERIRERVVAARDRQRARFAGRPGIYANAHMGPAEVKEYCRVGEAGNAKLRDAILKLGLSARAYHRVLKLARTIADLEETADIATAHVSEAIQYRSLDRLRPAFAEV
jgi:magnesium chelatase family protein